MMVENRTRGGVLKLAYLGFGENPSEAQLAFGRFGKDPLETLGGHYGQEHLGPC